MDKARRLFINRMAVLTGALAVTDPFKPFASANRYVNIQAGTARQLAVYYTNDVHGNIGAVHKGLGGLNHIKAILNGKRPGGLILDAGGFMTGSKDPAPQIKVISLMNAAGYCAAGLSGFELAVGRENLAALAPLMQFSLINCNHRFDGGLAKLVKPYIIMYRGAVKVGVTAVCQPLNGMHYMDAIESANQTAQMLKEEKKCDMVICLAHLGDKQGGTRSGNHELAAQSRHIDMIVGGDNHNLRTNALVLGNKMQHEVILTAAGWNGLMMGHTTICFNEMNRKVGVTCEHYIPGKSDGAAFSASLALLRNENDQLPHV